MGKRLFACGVVLFSTMVAIASIDARAEVESFLVLAGVASVTYVVTLWTLSRGADLSRRELVVCLALALAWRLPFLTAGPILSDDVYRYLWDGRVQRYGIDPYGTTPGDADLQSLHTDLTRRIDPTSAVLPTIYPPAAELLFRVVAVVDESVEAWLLVTLACDVAIAGFVWAWLIHAGRPPWWVLAYWWHPLVTIEGVGGGHIDLVGTLFVAGAAYALARRFRTAAAVSLALAFAVKFLPAVLAPLVWRRIRLRDAVVAAVVLAALYAPFITADRWLPLGSLAVYTEKWRFNGPLFAWLEPWLDARAGLGVAVLAGVGLAAAARWRLPADDPATWAWPMAGAMLCMPAVYPWYLLWLTPFLTSRAGWPLVTWTLASLLTYLVWRPYLAGGGWVLPAWVEWVEYGLVAGTAAVVVFRHGRRVDRASAEPG